MAGRELEMRYKTSVITYLLLTECLDYKRLSSLRYDLNIVTLRVENHAFIIAIATSFQVRRINRGVFNIYH